MHDFDEVASGIERALARNPEELAEERKRVAHEVVGEVDGQAGERVVDVIVERLEFGSLRPWVGRGRDRVAVLRGGLHRHVREGALGDRGRFPACRTSLTAFFLVAFVIRRLERWDGRFARPTGAAFTFVLLLLVYLVGFFNLGTTEALDQ